MRLKNVLASLAFVIAVSAIPTTAQPRPDWNGFKDLTLEVTTPKESYVQLEPIPLVLTLSNQTDRVLKGHNVLDFSASYIKVWTRAEGAEWSRINGLSTLIADVFVDPREMRPGYNFSDTQILNLRTEKIFPQPGTYEVKAEIISGDGLQTIATRPARIRIKEPEGRDLEAYNFLHANTRHEYFFTGRDLVRNKQAEQTLETFVAKFGDTAYGDYAFFLLAELRFAYREYDTARLQIERLAKKPDFALAKAAREYLEIIQRRQR